MTIFFHDGTCRFPDHLAHANPSNLPKDLRQEREELTCTCHTLTTASTGSASVTLTGAVDVR